MMAAPASKVAISLSPLPGHSLRPSLSPPAALPVLVPLGISSRACATRPRSSSNRPARVGSAGEAPCPCGNERSAALEAAAATRIAWLRAVIPFAHIASILQGFASTEHHSALFGNMRCDWASVTRKYRKRPRASTTTLSASGACSGHRQVAPEAGSQGGDARLPSPQPVLRKHCAHSAERHGAAAAAVRLWTLPSHRLQLEWGKLLRQSTRGTAARPASSLPSWKTTRCSDRGSSAPPRCGDSKGSSRHRRQVRAWALWLPQRRQEAAARARTGAQPPAHLLQTGPTARWRRAADVAAACRA